MIVYKNSTSLITVGKGTGAAGLGPRTISGLITTFGNPDHVNDVMHPNCLDRHLAEVGNRLPALSGHRVEEMIGWHTLTKADGVGVRTTMTFLEGIQKADEDLVRVKSGGMAFSIGFMVRREEWRRDQRWLMDIELLEASVVFLGCNPLAVIEQRSDVETERALRNLQSTIRSFGSQAKAERQKGMDPIERFLDNLKTYNLGESK